MKRGFVSVVIISAAILMGVGGCFDEQIEIEGAGASFPAPIYARWRALYHREHPDVSIHYRAVGSGEGVRRIRAKTVDFGASDVLLKPQEQRGLESPLLNIPTVLGPVVIAYNLPDLHAQLTLNAGTLAGIYLGEITHWDDPLIASINPDVALPHLHIRVAHRNDASGTTAIFTEYLSAVSARWRDRVGSGKRVFRPTDAKWAGEGNDGIAHRILLQRGGIGYLELKYAQNAGLKYAALINREGRRVLPTMRSVQSAERHTPHAPGSYLKPSIVNAPGEDSYPIASFTYLLVYEDMRDADPRKAHALMGFLRWILTEGQAEAAKLHFVPLPDALRRRVLETVGNTALPPSPEPGQ